jgi:hypothetical protein
MFLFYVVSYLLASIEEWMFHKYMHLKMNHSIQKTHLNHHANSNNKYEVSITASDDICFDIRNSNDFLQFLLFLVGNSTLLKFLFPYVSILTVTVTTSGLLTFNIFIWNTYHSYIHGLDSYTICFLKGIPRKYVPIANIYADWIIKNHQIHHKFPTGNFNIVFPGADYLFLTYDPLNRYMKNV